MATLVIGSYKVGPTPSGSAPGTPTGFAAISPSSSQVDLSWSATAGALSYHVDWSADGSTGWQPVAATPGLSLSHAGLSSGTPYYYRIKASNLIGSGGYATASVVTGGQGSPLAAPTGFAATAISPTQADLSWSPVAGASFYRVERTIPGLSGWSHIGLPDGTSARAENLDPASSYTFRVRAINLSGPGQLAQATATTPAVTTSPPTPTGIVVTPGSTFGFHLKWDFAAGASSYTVDKSTDNVTWTLVEEPVVPEVIHISQDYTPGQVWHYRIKATNAAGDSAYAYADGTSLAADVVAPAPAALTATATSPTTVDLSWTASPGAFRYVVWRQAPDELEWSVLDFVAGTGYRDFGLIGGVTYGYRVGTENLMSMGGYGPFATASVTTPAVSAPAAPSGLTATASSYKQINLSWNPVVGATSYRVEKSYTGTDKTWARVGDTDQTSLSAVGLIEDTAYHFRVAAWNDGGPSSFSTATETTQQVATASYSATPTVHQAGWCTLGVPAPKRAIPAGTRVVAGALPTQFDVKSTWPDGSCRMGVLTAKFPSTGDITLSTTTIGPPEPWTPAAPPATTVTFHYYDRFRVWNTFTVNSGTLNVTIYNAGAYPYSPTIASAIRINPAGNEASSTIINVGDPGFSTVGTWGTSAGGGFRDQTALLATGSDSTKTATWSFTGLAPGNYRVAYYFPPDLTNEGHTSSTTMKAFDGATLVGQLINTVNQSSVVQDESATILLEPSPTVYTATLPSTIGTDTWLDGPLCKEWLHVVAPVRTDDSSNSPDPSLRVYFYVRAYNDTGNPYMIDVKVENGLDVPGNYLHTYDVAVGIGGSTVFSASKRSHYTALVWRREFAVGHTPGIVIPDWEPAIKAHGVLRPHPLMQAKDYPTGDPDTDPHWMILPDPELGDLVGDGYDMTVGGKHEFIGINPSWAMQNIRYRDYNSYKYMLRMSELFGSIGYHLRAGDGSFITDKRFVTAPGSYGVTPIANSGWAGPNSYHTTDVAHVGAVMLPCYLATGHRYWADQVALWTTGVWTHYTAGNAAPGINLRGLDYSRSGQGTLISPEQTRTFGWGLRLFAQGGWLPDGHPLISWVEEGVMRTLSDADQLASDYHHEDWPFHLFPTGLYHDPLDRIAFITFQSNYNCMALNYVNDLGYHGGMVWLDQLVRLTTKTFVGGKRDPNDPDWYPITWTTYIILGMGMINVNAGAPWSYGFYRKVRPAGRDMVTWLVQAQNLGGEKKAGFAGFYSADHADVLFIADRYGVPDALYGYQILLDANAPGGVPGPLAFWFVDRNWDNVCLAPTFWE